MTSIDKKEIYEYVKGLYSTFVYLDNSFNCVFFNTVYPSWATQDSKRDFLESAEHAVMKEVEKQFQVGV